MINITDKKNGKKVAKRAIAINPHRQIKGLKKRLIKTK